MKIIGRQLLIIFSLPYCNIFFGMTKADGNQIVCSYQSTEQNLSLLFLSLNVTHADCYKTREKLCSFFNNTAQERRTCNMSRSKKDFHIDFFEIEDYLETACKLYYQRTSMLYVIKAFAVMDNTTKEESNLEVCPKKVQQQRSSFGLSMPSGGTLGSYPKTRNRWYILVPLVPCLLLVLFLIFLSSGRRWTLRERKTRHLLTTTVGTTFLEDQASIPV
ncbi:uncharacterized protein LOC106703417 [Latimeria chalumnae]|uniref:uncharacterized protein LOC106703417 n=1 Tax=Latimeria chalumnae TaxID=7897 RepID=UPI00313BFE27